MKIETCNWRAAFTYGIAAMGAVMKRTMQSAMPYINVKCLKQSNR